MRILVVEDEPDLQDVLRQGLEDAHYAVHTAGDGRTALEMASTATYSAIVLDIMIPHVNGWQVCSTLREQANPVPILMLTARDSVPDKVKGLNLGADDYLPKPFDFDELVARVNALVRRDRVQKGQIIRVGDLEIDTVQHKVSRGNTPIALTPREFSLLEALAGHSGQVLSRDVIQERVWLDDESYSNTVDVYIRSLRKKVDTPDRIKLIHTHHGIGYSVQAPAESGT